jgi:hypothetical protein
MDEHVAAVQADGVSEDGLIGSLDQAIHEQEKHDAQGDRS